MSTIPSRTLAARLAGRLHAAALLALLALYVPPALAQRPIVNRAAPITRAQLQAPAQTLSAATGVSASMTDALLTDTNRNGRADPGETLRYTVVVGNSSGSDLTGVTFDDTLDPNTSLIAGSLLVGPLAFDDSYATLRDTPLAVGAPGLLANDTGTPPLSVQARSVATAAGGTATTSADGSFSYTPPPSYTGIDSFSYSVANSVGSNTGLVRLAVRAVPIAADDSYSVASDTSRTIPAPGVLSNDLGFPPPSVTPFSGPTAAGGAVTIAGDGGFSYSAPPGFTGDDTFVYTAVNAAGSDTATVTMTVGLAPVAQNDTGYTATLDTPLSVAAGTGVLQNDTLGSPAATVLSFGGGALPGTAATTPAGTTASFGTGGALKLNADGSFTFTPSAGFTGSFSFGYRIGNLFGSSDALATIAVQQIPAITSTDLVTFTIGTLGSFTVTSSGFPTPTIAIGGDALPAGVTFADNGNGSGTLGGTPGAGTAGAYHLTFTANNAAGSSAPQSFTLLVEQGPAITSANATTFTTETLGSFTVTATGFPTPTLTQAGALPAGVAFVDNGDGTATLAGTPAAGTGGSYPLVFGAANSAGASSQNFTLVVGEPPLIGSGAAATFTVGTAGSFTIAASGYPTPTITRGGASLPLGLVFTNLGDGTATLSGTPASGSGGVRHLTFTASNSAGSSAPQDFTLTIREAPAITSLPSAALELGVPGSFTITASGFPTPTLTQNGTLPAGVTFVDNGDGTATLGGTPSGPSGSYPLSIGAANAVGASAPQSFSLIVGSAPAFTSANASTMTVGVPGSWTIATSGYPAAAITLTGALPNGVTFIDNSDGTATLTGVPEAGSEGSYALTFDAGNLFGASAPQSFTLTVQPAGPRAGAPGPAASVGASIGTIPAGKQVTLQFDVTIASPLPIGVGQLSNQGSVSGSGFAGVLTDDPRAPGAADPTITALGARKVYLPLIMYKVGPPLPDLVVSGITVVGGNIQVTIRNNGQLAASDPFWVDAYINPTTAPVRVNQLWNTVGKRGVSWAVVGGGLPLDPGEELTLTVGDAYYRATLSDPGGAIAAGAQLYAQVDSFGSSGNTGMVLETHERDGEAYNNILGPVAAP